MTSPFSTMLPSVYKPIVQEAIHAGTDLDLLRTRGDADELEGDRRVLRLDLHDGHFGLRGWRRFRLAAAGQQ